MKWIVITSPDAMPGEAFFIDRLFHEGLDLLHLRKPEADEETYARLIEAIPEAWHHRLVLHDHFELTHRYALHGIHLNRRHPEAPAGFGGSCSASCHSFEEVAQKKSSCDYLFLSPIFNSISKQGYEAAFTPQTLQEAARKGLIDSQVVALGGITLERIQQLHDWHFGGAAFLGDIWQRMNDPHVSTYLSSLRKRLSRFQSCQELKRFCHNT